MLIDGPRLNRNYESCQYSSLGIKMDDTPITLTSLILLVFIVVAIIMLLLHYLGNREQFWTRSYKEEKIGLSGHKLFKTNGYMIHSGSELLLSSSGSFKRFDTVDRESCKHSNNITRKTSPKQCTTPLWNLPQTDNTIPPQPLRPAPAPHSSNGSNGAPTKTVKFLFDYENEIHSSSDTHSLDDSDQNEMLSLNTFKLKNATLLRQREIDIPTLEAPPPTRATTNHTNTMLTIPSTALPRPVARKSLSPTHQNGSQTRENRCENGSSEIDTIAHTNTNPFLETTGTGTNGYNNKSQSNTALNQSQLLQPIDGNPFIATTSASERIFRNRSLSQTAENVLDNQRQEDNVAATSLKNLANAFHQPQVNAKYGNPFASVVKKVKSPYMLQKTISEDFLFRKLTPPVDNAAPSYPNGTTSWNFGRLLIQNDASFNLWRRNSSQCSLDSGSLGSTDSINIERAISCDSVDSFLSTESNSNCENQSSTYTQITGYLCVRLHYDKNSITEEGMDLNVSVLEAKGLVLPFRFETLDTFVRIYLVPDQAGALETQIFKNSYVPTYNESFNFWFKTQEKKHSLWFHLYHSGAAHTLIGEAEMEIGEMPRPITTWIPLTDSRKCNARWGELMFSLSYLPTAERLTIVVVKGRNLQLQLPNKNDATVLEEVQQIFVKVYLMNNEKKILKKRTSMKRKDRCPIFNESVIFNLPPHNLTTAQIRITVFGVMDDKAAGIQPIGHVVAGSYATGKGLRHWHQMLSSLRKPVAMWHVLRRATNQPIFTGGADAVVAAMQTTAQRAKRNSVI